MKVLFIHKLTLFTFIYALCNSFFYNKVLFYHEIGFFKSEKWTKWLKKYSIERLGYHQIGINHYYINCGQHLDFVDTVFEKEIKTLTVYGKIINYFKMSEETEKKFECSIKRIIAKETYLPCDNLLLIHNYIKKYASVNPKLYFPDAAHLYSDYIKEFNINNISLVCRINSHLVKTIVSIAYYIVYGGILFFYALKVFVENVAIRLNRGSNDEMDLTKVSEYPIGYFPFSNTFHTKSQTNRFYFETVLYSENPDSPLYKSNILHLFTKDVIDKDTSNYLKQNKIPYMNISHIKKGLPYYKRMMSYFLAFWIHSYGAHLPEKILILYTARIFWWENIFKSLGISYYYLAYDMQFSKLALTVMSMLDITSISSTYAEECHMTYYQAYYNYDYYYIPGERTREFCEKKRSYIKNYSVTGVTRSDIIYENRDKRVEKYKKITDKVLVTAIDFGQPSNVYDKTIPAMRLIIRDSIKIFYNGLCALLDKYQDLYIISCLRKKESLEYYKNDSYFRDIYEKMIIQKRLSLDYEHDTYQLIAMSDICIINHSSTTGIESLAAGKKILYYDFTGDPYHGYRKYGIVPDNQEQLLETFDLIFNQQDDFDWRRIRRENCGEYWDGNCRERIRNKIIELLSSCKPKIR
ncbi:MAG: hypothetical protein ACMUIP_02465 [bacterium]